RPVPGRPRRGRNAASGAPQPARRGCARASPGQRSRGCMRIAPELVRELAFEAGFDVVKFGPPHPGPDGDRFLAWLDAGRAGEMHYLERNRDRIADPATWLPQARSTIALAWDY